MFDRSVSSALQHFDTNLNTGLSSVEVKLRLERYGKNVTEQVKKKSIVARFFNQFSDLMIIILLVASALSFVIALYSKETTDLLEPIIIVLIVVINAVLGTAQEYRAEKSLEALKRLSSPKTKVLRDGVVSLVDSQNIVCGDICIFEAGDIVTADCRLAEAESLSVNESALTGESLPVDKTTKTLGKNVQLADRTNCVFCGSFITNGRCRAIVISTGMQTEIGKIAGMLGNTTSSLTPLQQRLKHLSKVIGIMCLVVCALVLVVGFISGASSMQEGDSLINVFMDIFLTSVSLAVAAIPEGLPAVVTIVLSGGIEKMAKHKAIVKTLTAVETLGCSNVICTDKTGTLTQNQMELVSAFDGNKLFDTSNENLQNAIKHFCYCCDVTKNNTGWLGDPTEIAVIKHYSGFSPLRVFEIPFDSQRKMMTVVVRENGKHYAITKGSFEAIMLNSDNADMFVEKNEIFTSKGYRVLAVAYKEVESDFQRNKTLESNLHIECIVAISDSIRSETISAVNECKSAGIRAVMITGDNLNTAKEIARQVGIMCDGDKAIDGKMLSKMSDDELDRQIENIAVFARVTPSDKLRIVNAWQRIDKVVAMTGDGVNDAPALKKADIGCAMGSGTDVAKNSADMILADDNFATIVEAVAEGRGVYDNIKNTVRYLLTCNIGEVLTVFVALLLWNAVPLGAMQLLWINLITDGLPSLALGIEKRADNIMSRLPKPRNETFFAGGTGKQIVYGGLLFGVITLVAYAVGGAVSHEVASTMAFLVLSLSQLIFAMQLRNNKTKIFGGISTILFLSFVTGVVLLTLVMTVPFLQSLFELTSLSFANVAISIGLAIVPSIAMSIFNLISRKANK